LEKVTLLELPEVEVEKVMLLELPEIKVGEGDAAGVTRG